MDSIQKYVSDELAKITGVDILLTDREYNGKSQTFSYILKNFRWIGADNFIEIVLRRFRHVLGKDLDDFVEISYVKGQENIHSYDFVLYLKVLIDLDTLAGYLRLTKEEREKLV